MPARVHSSQTEREVFRPDVTRLNDDLSGVVNIPIPTVLYDHERFVLSPAKGGAERYKKKQNQQLGKTSPMLGYGGSHAVPDSKPENSTHEVNYMPD